MTALVAFSVLTALVLVGAVAWWARRAASPRAGRTQLPATTPPPTLPSGFPALRSVRIIRGDALRVMPVPPTVAIGVPPAGPTAQSTNGSQDAP